MQNLPVAWVEMRSIENPENRNPDYRPFGAQSSLHFMANVIASERQ